MSPADRADDSAAKDTEPDVDATDELADADVTDDVDDVDDVDADAAEPVADSDEDSEDSDDADDADDDVDESTADSGKPGRATRLPMLVLTAAVALAVAAAAVAVWFGVAWIRAENDESLAYSKVRDEVTRVATAAVITMNTLDYRKVDEHLQAWADATTGPLHDEIVNLGDQDRQAVIDSKSVGTAKVHSAAVRELDERAGKAVVLAAVQIDVGIDGAAPTPKWQRLECHLTRTESGWKLESIGQVPFTPASQ